LLNSINTGGAVIGRRDRGAPPALAFERHGGRYR